MLMLRPCEVFGTLSLTPVHAFEAHPFIGADRVAGALLSVSALLLTFLVSKDLGREKQQAKANVAFAEDTATEELQPLTLNDEVDDFLEENAAK